jgi:glycerate kinase
MRIIIAPGAFKNSLSALAVAQAIEKGLTRSKLPAELYLAPIADGGNGTLDAYLANGGERVSLRVDGPLGTQVEASYGLIDNGQTAVIEMAQASGLELVSGLRLDPLNASTYGTGQLMQAALERGVKRVIVGMGGSATVDGGAGCLQALGVELLDAYGEALPRGGGHLHKLFVIDTQSLDPRWKAVDVIIAADVDTPTLGQNGAAAVFGPQKGATPEQVQTLENNLSHFFKVVQAQLGIDVRTVPGGGAAGAFSAGLMAFLGGHIEPGIDLILKHGGFEQAMPITDLVITGEGRLDSQTLAGKGPLGIAKLAKQHGVPTVAIVGSLAGDDAVLHEAGIHAVLPIAPGPITLDEAIRSAEGLIEQAALRLGYLLQLGGVK